MSSITEKPINIKPAEAAQLLGTTAQFIRVGLQRDKFPWGYAVKLSPNRYTYYINRVKLCELEGINENR